MSHAYDKLSPELILDAVESIGLIPSGHSFALNSYENRVYQIGIEDAPNVIAKFYRPERWSNSSIQEEHDFSLALAENEVPVIAPWQNQSNQTLFEFEDFRFAIFPQRGGRTPNLENLDDLEWIGRFIGRIHLQGSAKGFEYRPAITPDTFGHNAQQRVLDSAYLPIELKSDYASVTEQLLLDIEQAFSGFDYRAIRLHGDCHPGNILWTDNGPHFVDMDDCRSGPAVQDLWMLLSGSRREMTEQLGALLAGYETFCEFDCQETALIEPLRALRLIHYTAWLCDRWNDPAFPLAFPWFEDRHYWESHINDLRQQILLIQEPPLAC